jgi:serine protease Do
VALLCGPAPGWGLDRGTRLASKVFREAADKVSPSVVAIEAYGDLREPETRDRRRPPVEIGSGPATGTLISSNGHILTCTFSFIRKQPVITVVLADGSRHVARLLGRDDDRKLCLLKIDGVGGLPVPDLIAMRDLKVGQWAVAVGRGYGGHEPAISAGIVSATRRLRGRAVQTDANISPANYGGPLVDLEGRVIGICAPLVPPSHARDATTEGLEWHDTGIGFAVPIKHAGRWIAAMKEGRTVKRVTLGARVSQPPAEYE